MALLRLVMMAAITLSICLACSQDEIWNQQEERTTALPWVRADDEYTRLHNARVETPVEHARRSEQLGIADGTCDRERIGALLGGLLGGMLGRRIGGEDNSAAGTVAGVVIGVLIGRQIGKSMDDADEACTGQVLERAYDGQTVHWSNPDSGVRYAVTPERTFIKGDRFCRSYVTEADLPDRPKTMQATACRNEDGSWERRE